MGIPNNLTSKYIKQKLTELGERNRFGEIDL